MPLSLLMELVKNEDGKKMEICDYVLEVFGDSVT